MNHQDKHHHAPGSHREKLVHGYRKVLHHLVNFQFRLTVVAFFSLLWLLLRSGTKPSRLQYPCQKAAAANVGLYLTLLPVPFAGRLIPLFHYATDPKRIRRFLWGVIFLSISALAAVVVTRKMRALQFEHANQDMRKSGAIGKRIVQANGLLAGFQTIPAAASLTSPHRVVSVHNSTVTSWDFSCTGYGVCGEYYGDNSFVHQSVVDNMVDLGLEQLTGKPTIQEAWHAILPSYAVGQKIAMKVNFNDSLVGGGSGTGGYSDADAYLDALPQIVNSLIKGLKTIGVQENDIWVYDASRWITDRFRARIIYTSIGYFDHYGNGSDVQLATFNSSNPSAQIDFSGTGYPYTHKVSDVLVNATYLINIPIMKVHQGAGITLSLKNHLGTINNFFDGMQDSPHAYWYIGGAHYSSTSNPLVNINLNPHIKNKTILIVGDGLYGAQTNNNQAPARWSSFNNGSPNMLFFAADPVAADSVMYDFINRERALDARCDDILKIAATAGLGVREHWDGNNTRKYSTIDYIEYDFDAPPAGTPTPSPSASPSISPTPSPTPTRSVSPSPSSSSSPTPTPTQSPSPSPSQSPTPIPSASPSPTTTASSTPTPVTGFLPFKNIFNPTTQPISIKFAIQAQSAEGITLAVYDRFGSKIRDLDVSNQNGSQCVATWNGRNSDGTIVASGTYVLLLKDSAKTYRQMIVVVK